MQYVSPKMTPSDEVGFHPVWIYLSSKISRQWEDPCFLTFVVNHPEKPLHVSCYRGLFLVHIWRNVLLEKNILLFNCSFRGEAWAVRWFFLSSTFSVFWSKNSQLKGYSFFFHWSLSPSLFTPSFDSNAHFYVSGGRGAQSSESANKVSAGLQCRSRISKGVWKPIRFFSLSFSLASSLLIFFVGNIPQRIRTGDIILFHSKYLSAISTRLLSILSSITCFWNFLVTLLSWPHLF